MRYIKRRYYKQKLEENILKKLMIIMVIGSILGALFFCFMNNETIEKLNMFIGSFLDVKNDISFNFAYYIEKILKGIKYYLFIWFLAYIPWGNIFIYIVIFAKGFFVSFTTATFFNKYSFKGIGYIFSTYIFENIIVISLIFYISYKAIYYCKNKKNIYINNYIKNLIVCMIIHLILSFIIFI